MSVSLDDLLTCKFHHRLPVIKTCHVRYIGGRWVEMNHFPTMELPSVYECDERKARKDHKCCECRGIISKGEIYNYHHGIWDGQAESFKVCSDCESLRGDIDVDAKEEDERTAFTDLYCNVFERGELTLIQRYMDIKTKRHAPIEEWMIKKVDELLNKEDDELDEDYPDEIWNEESSGNNGMVQGPNGNQTVNANQTP